MNENEPNEFANTMEYTNINSTGISSRNKLYQSGLSDTEKDDIIAYLQNLIDIVEKDRVRNAEIKITNETTKMSEDFAYYHIPTGIKTIELMIRFN